MEKTEQAANFIANIISEKTKISRNILLFVTGGSSIKVALKLAEILKENTYNNLTVMLTDERYGPINHADSNWQQLLGQGFHINGAKLISILTGDDANTTTQKFNESLQEELKKDSYKIGMFGIGADGHTAGILPHTGAVDSTDLAYTYKTEKFERITITPKTIIQLDEAVVYARGEDKWPVLKDLGKEKSIEDQPAQILKKVKLLKMFTDNN